MRALIALAVSAAAFTATTPAAAPKQRKPDTASEFGGELDLSLAFFREEGRPARDLAMPVSYTHLTLPTICSV